MKFSDINSETQERSSFLTFPVFRIGSVKMQISCLGNVSVIIFPKHSIDGEQYGANVMCIILSTILDT